MPSMLSHRLRFAAPLGLLMALHTGCSAPTVELTNLEPARQMARQAQPAPGAMQAGWRVFQQRCAQCHGPAADGMGGAPNLLVRMQGLAPRRFVDLVLRRYEGLAPSTGADRETLIDDLVERRSGELNMPAWQGNPMVQAHVMDLYAYLSARAEGRLSAGEPPAR